MQVTSLSQRKSFPPGNPESPLALNAQASRPLTDRRSSATTCHMASHCSKALCWPFLMADSTRVGKSWPNTQSHSTEQRMGKPRRYTPADWLWTIEGGTWLEDGHAAPQPVLGLTDYSLAKGAVVEPDRCKAKEKEGEKTLTPCSQFCLSNQWKSLSWRANRHATFMS